MPFTELVTSRSSNTTSNGQITGTRVWFYDSPDAVAARIRFRQDVPDYATFPDNPAIRYNSHDVSVATGNGGCNVTANYSTAQFTAFTPRRAPEDNRIDWSSVRLDVNIPLSQTRSITQERPPPLGAVKVLVWEQTKVFAPIVCPVVVINVNISGGSARQFDVAAYETGNVHVIEGEALQLLEASVDRQGENNWRVVYRYISDRGTLVKPLPIGITFTPPTGRPASDPYTGVPTDRYWRLPFETLVAGRSPDPINVPHSTLSIRPVLNPNGWRNLPGSEYFNRDILPMYRNPNEPR